MLDFCMMNEEAPVSSSTYLCEHCDQHISKTLYYQHKKFFYSADSGTWKKITAEVNKAATIQIILNYLHPAQWQVS